MNTPNAALSILGSAFAVAAVLATTARAHAAPLVVESLTGPITPNEIAAFKAYMQTQTVPPHSYGAGTDHNALADGTPGRDVEAMGMMFEATGDVAILDRMIFFVDGFLGLRNDLPNGEHVTLWTGNVDKVWIPNPPSRPPQNYAGGENGDTVAHIEYCALLIARNPALWNMTVPDADPHGYGATYLQRAKTYIASADEANDEYSVKYFVVPGTNLIRNPPNWPAGFHTMEAINIQMMLDGAFQRNAEVHEALGDAPARVAQYDAIVKTSTRECLDGMKHPVAKNGHMPDEWGYYPWATSFNESVGHGAYDVLGIWRASTRSAYGLAPSELAPIGDALVYGISLGNGSFAALVDGTGGSTTWLSGEWITTTDWNGAAYDLVANADVASGRQGSDAHMTAAILWMKQRLFSPPDAGVGPSPDASAPPPPLDGGSVGTPDDAGAAGDEAGSLTDAAAPDAAGQPSASGGSSGSAPTGGNAFAPGRSSSATGCACSLPLRAAPGGNPMAIVVAVVLAGWRRAGRRFVAQRSKPANTVTPAHGPSRRTGVLP